MYSVTSKACISTRGMRMLRSTRANKAATSDPSILFIHLQRSHLSDTVTSHRYFEYQPWWTLTCSASVTPHHQTYSWLLWTISSQLILSLVTERPLFVSEGARKEFQNMIQEIRHIMTLLTNIPRLPKHFDRLDETERQPTGQAPFFRRV